MHQKIVYILPVYEEGTDTHLFYNYELIRAAARKLDIFVVIEKCATSSVAQKLGARCYVQRFKNPLLRFFELLFILKVARLRGYKNFYTHYSYYGAIASWLVTQFGGQVFYWNRGMPWLFKRSFVEERVFRFILRHTTLVTSPASLAEEYVRRYGVRRYQILSNWIDYERFYPHKKKTETKAALGFDPAKKLVLFVHHLSERKGADFIMPVAKKLHDTNVFFAVAGDGPYLEKLKAENSKVNNIKMLGKVPNSEVIRLFQAADVFFMPSREEGSPHVILEAMAAGTPFVASDVGGIAELTSSVAKKFLCAVGDIECYARKISQLLSDQAAYDAARDSSLDYVKQFGKERALAEFIGLFTTNDSTTNDCKLLYIANARMPTERAHGIQLAKMCEALVKSGADLELVLPKRKTGEESIEQFYGFSTKIPIKKLPVLSLYRFGKIGFWVGSFSFAVSYFLYILWRRICGDRLILYTIDMDQFSFFAVPALGLPYFVEMHDAKEKNLVYSWLLRRARGIVVINNLIKEKIAKRFRIHPEKITVHPNGIDLQQFDIAMPQREARARLGLPNDRRIALYVGKVYDWKGMEILADAAAYLGADTYLYLVGATESEFHQACGGKIPSNIVCVGQRDYKEIAFWLKAADVLLVLGTKKNEYSYYHTSPMKMFEYMASRTPIVASKTPAVMQAVSDAEVVFYTPDDAKNLAEKIEYTVSHHPELAAKIDAAHRRVLPLSWEKRASAILSFISSRAHI